VGDQAGGHLEFVQQRRRGLAELAVSAVLPTETERAAAQGVPVGVVLQPGLADQLVENPVGGGARQPGMAGHVLQRQAGRTPVEGVEDEGHPFDHRRRRLVAHRGFRGLLAHHTSKRLK